ncbi:MAG TPA: hypothetical protein VNP98_12270 [Chthoniobacterales bacterium]|nr:hypothetical protein [Chthoniobacterales bacterium]
MAQFPGIRTELSTDSRKGEAQIHQIDGFCEIHVKPGLLSTQLIRGCEVGADGNRDHARIISPHLGNEIVAILIGQTDVTENHVHVVSV